MLIRLMVTLVVLFELSHVVHAADYNNSLYYHARQDLWHQVYRQGGETLYCGQVFKSSNRSGLNVEHVLPMAWVMNRFGCQDRDSCRRYHASFRQIEADLHNLYPARIKINQLRGSMPFGMVRGEARHFGRCDFEIDRRRRVVEPREAVRGDIARTLAYMHDRYGIRIHQRQKQLMVKWNRQDPPSAEEKNRNNIIERLQGNRNTFIDQPDAVTRLFR